MVVWVKVLYVYIHVTITGYNFFHFQYCGTLKVLIINFYMKKAHIVYVIPPLEDPITEYTVQSVGLITVIQAEFMR